MKESPLYSDLKNAYTLENLTMISSRIINYYRNKEYDYIRGIMRKINDIVNFNEEKINKIFSKLIMLYHPDRLSYYLGELEKCYKNNDIEKLSYFSHILLVLDNTNQFDGITSSDIEVVYASDIDWGYDEEDLDYFTEINQNHFDDEYGETDEDNYEDFADGPTRDFLSALKRKEYGNLNIELGYHDLKYIEGELELSDYEIEDITGIEHCRNITSLDLSNNNISVISNLSGLRLLEDIDLSYNQVTDIFVLGKLKNLKNIDLSGNMVDDISPLFDLPALTYLNILGNHVPKWQTDTLKKKGIVVIC